MNNEKIFLAVMYSESYNWCSWGKTEESAKRGILKEWNRQAKNCAWMERATLRKLEEYYGFNIMELHESECELF